MDSTKLRRLTLFLLFWPYFWRMTTDKGFNDILVAVSVLFAIHWHGKCFIKSAITLALGTMVKLIPLVILPFLVFNFNSASKGFKKFEIHLKYLLTFVGCLLIGYGTCYLIWGEQVWEPFSFMGDRHSKQLSIFRFLRGDFSPLQLFMSNPNLDKISSGVLAMILIGYFLYTKVFKPIISNENLILGCLIITFALFKIGHIQFFLCLFFLIPYYYLTKGFEPSLRKSLKYFLIWLTVYDIFYSISGGYYHEPFHRVREFAGLIHFGFSLYAAVRPLKSRVELEP